MTLEVSADTRYARSAALLERSTKSLAALATSGLISVVFLILMGFCNSLNWPCIWPLALKGLGSNTKTASAMLIMAIAGGALLPAVYAQINTLFGGNSGVILLFILYTTILGYSTCGYKLTNWNMIPGKSVLYGREK